MRSSPKQIQKITQPRKNLRQRKSSKVSSLLNCLNELKLQWDQKGNIASLLHHWPMLVGEQLAKNSQPISLRRGTLIIGAPLPQWRQALQYNRIQLLATLKAAGHEIKEIRIQQYHSTKPKKIESQENIWARHPSRVDIHGISKCDICKNPAPAGEIELWGRCGFCRRKNLNYR